MINSFDYADYESAYIDEWTNSDRTKELCQKYQNKVDFSMKSKGQTRDKSERATTEHSLDKRTIGILFKMLSQGRFSEINGCISTGKEANVYHAVSEFGDLALKVYMTSKMTFKSRNKYVEGDFRMRHGYSTSTSWKQVSKWSEKEYRNLIRIVKCGSIPAPKPLLLKNVVLLMTLIGKNGCAAPKLKDVTSGDWSDFGPPPDWHALYKQILENVRTLFQECRLVHGDLSEYNLLFMDGKAWFIDVSQAVEHESNQALELLRNDCYNVNAFFRHQAINTLTLREFFEWVVDPTLPESIGEARGYLEKLLAAAEARGCDGTLLVEDDAFRRVYVPRRLEDVKRYMSDLRRVKKGIMPVEDLYYTSVTGVSPMLPVPKRETKEEVEEELVEVEEDASSIGASDNESSDSGSQLGGGDKPAKKSNRRPHNETLEEKRLRKKAVQEAKAEKRKTKVPKYVKKRSVKGK